MNGKKKLFLLFSAFLLTMCTSHASEPVTYANGLSCQNYTNVRFFEQHEGSYNIYNREEGANCSYVCSDGTIREINVTGVDSPLYSSSKEDLDAEICGIVPQPSPTAMESLLTAFPVSTLSAAEARASRTAAATSIVRTSPTAGVVTVGPIIPFLTGSVSMCDLGGKLINFRIAQPPQNLTGRSLEVQLAERDSFCRINRTNASLLTCTIPVGVSFPASITVRLDGRVVNDFIYNGLGCAVLTTPTPLPRPTDRSPRPTDTAPPPTTYP